MSSCQAFDLALRISLLSSLSAVTYADLLAVEISAASLLRPLNQVLLAAIAEVLNREMPSFHQYAGFLDPLRARGTETTHALCIV